MNIRYKKGKMIIEADSDTLIVKGLVSILLQVFSNRKPAEVLENEFYLPAKAGFLEFFPESRANGINAMLKFIMESAKTLSLI